MEKKISRILIKDKASSYNIKLIDKLRTKIYLLKQKKIIIGKNSVIKKNVEFNLTDNAEINIGQNSIVKANSYFILTKPNPKVIMGNYSGIGRNNYVSIKGTFRIGNYVRIGPDVCFIDQDHSFSANDLIMNQKAKIENITIKDDVWIGRGVTVLKGVTINKGAVIAANALVNKDIPEYEIWGGVPAKFIKKRI